MIETYTMSNEDLKAMMDALHYGTATPMIWLVKKLNVIHKNIEKGFVVSYVDDLGMKQQITKDNFEEFCLQYFDAFVFKEVFTTSKLYE